MLKPIRKYNSMIIFVRLFILIVLCYAAPTQAEVDKNWQEKVPTALKGWIPWVLKDQPRARCLTINGQIGQEICTWYSGITIKLEADYLEFEQTVDLVRPGQVYLSFAEKTWPTSVKTAEKNLAVISANGRPVVYLPEGTHKIVGRLAWQAPPPNIKLPEATGTIKLSVAKGLPDPELDNNSNLWLRSRTETKQVKQEQDFISYQIFRRIEDDIPVRLETIININVGGRDRDIILPDLFLGSSPYNIHSQMPVRIDRERRLWIRVTAGRHSVKLYSILPAPFKSLQLTDGHVGIVDREVWSFSARPELRSAILSGLDRVDPQQVNVPTEWQNLPAFVVATNQILKVDDFKRADVQSQANELQLSRILQLHASGEEYSVRDQLNGTIYSDGRLNIIKDIKPGSISINSVDQAITTIGDESVGVEVRAGNLNLNMDGRVSREQSNLPVTGWESNISNPSLTLYLPPGWSLLHATSADQISGAWLQKWDLLKIFLLLTTVVLVQRLMGFSTAGITAVTLILIEHHFTLSGVLIFVLIINVLLKYCGTNLFTRLLSLVKNVTLIGLILAFASFSLERIRLAIYPQLDWYAYSSNNYTDRVQPAAVKYDDVRLEQAPAELEESYTAAEGSGLTRERNSYTPKLAAKVSSLSSSRFNYLIDSMNLPQTGYGKVNISGRQYNLKWSGLVSQSEKFKLYLLSPFYNLLLAFVQVLLGAWIIFKLSFNSLQSLKVNLQAGKVAMLIIGLLPLFSTNLRAEDNILPTTELLRELKDYAVKNEYPAALCLPECGKVTDVNINVKDQDLNITVEVHASSKVAIDLLSGYQNIQFIEAQSSTTDSSNDFGLMRWNNKLFIAVSEGKQVVNIKAKMSGSSASLAFANIPTKVTAKLDGWKVSGINEGQAKEVRFERTAELVEQAIAKDKTGLNAVQSVFLEPLVTLQRQIILGSEWQVNSTISLASANTSVVELQIPLLAGEAVTTAGAVVKDNKLRLTLQPGSLSYNWSSALKIQDQLELQATSSTNMAEIWQVEVSNLWHADFSGTPRIQGAAGQSLETAIWQPLPEEKLNITISRPTAIPGPTRTINSADITYDVGDKLVKAVLKLDIQSSLGQPYLLKLPEDVEVTKVLHNDQNITSFSIKDGSIRIDLNPGQQRFELHWNQSVKLGSKFAPAALNLDTPVVNINTVVKLPHNRWVLWLTGPVQGPAILFWGLLPVLMIAAYGVFRSGLTPFTFFSAFLLMCGLSFQPLSRVIIIFGFFIVLGWRGKRDLNQDRRSSNLMQFIIGGWAILTVSSLLQAVRHGLLGTPNMRIAGNGSYSYVLNWYQDVSSGSLPEINIFSFPLSYYRAAMLIWALWLAFSVIKWSIWGWNNYTRGGAWVARKPKPKSEDGKTEAK